MSMPGQPGVDHEAYLSAVCRGLRARSLLVSMRTATCGSGRRAGILFVRPAGGALAGVFPAEAVLTWDEEAGWSLAARADPGALAYSQPVWKGPDVAPDPEDVAVWAMAALAHPRAGAVP